MRESIYETKWKAIKTQKGYAAINKTLFSTTSKLNQNLLKKHKHYRYYQKNYQSIKNYLSFIANKWGGGGTNLDLFGI